MKQTIKKLIIFTMILSTSVQAVDEFYRNCDKPEYVCGCNPLYCDSISLEVRAGVAPIIWRKRPEINLIACASNEINPVFLVASSFPKFSDLYKLPWIIGAIVGYAVTDNIQVYLEANYLQAKIKNGNVGFSFPIPGVSSQALVLQLDKYKLVDVYIGARYYFDRWCESTAFFLGTQVGFTTHRSADALLTLGGIPVSILPTDICTLQNSFSAGDNGFFANDTVISGGLNAGIDYCFCGDWSITLTGEFIASCGPRTRTTSILSTQVAPLLATNLIIGALGTELRFPITLGIKHTF